MSKRTIKRIKLKINWKQFVVSYAIWCVGAIISIIPTLTEYLNLRAMSENFDGPSILEHILNDTNMIYSVVSVVVVAFSDLVLDLVREGAEFKTIKWFLTCGCILSMISASLVFGLSSNWSDGTSLIPEVIRVALIVTFALCTIIYLVKNAETKQEKKRRKP